MPKLNRKLIAEALKLGGFKAEQEAVKAALSKFVSKRSRLRILELAGQIKFHPDWDYKRMRRR